MRQRVAVLGCVGAPLDARACVHVERHSKTSSQITRVRITGNSIHDNGALGIDLLSPAGGAGVTPNDPQDPDIGGNNLQNFPVITAASSSSSGTSIVGTFNSTANSTFTLQFFSSATCDPSGHGEGQTFIGSMAVVTDVQGDVAFEFLMAAIEQGGRVITATATDATGNTSEFSACATVISTVAPGDANGDGAVDVDDLIAVILAWGACAACSDCPADVDDDCDVDVDDLIAVILNWG